MASRRRAFGPETVLLLTVALFGLPSSASGQAFRAEDGHVSFTSSVVVHKFSGESDHLVGRIDLADSTVDFYVDLETLKTGIGKRDRDMRITLETKQFPFGEFYGKIVSPFDLHVDSAQSVKVVGDFSIHGITRTIEVSGTLNPGVGSLDVEAEWPLNLEDFKIVPPSLLMLTVDQIQIIRIEARLHPELKTEGKISS